MSVTYSFQDQVVIVTGGTTGIGEACCKAFVSAGAAAVYNVDINAGETPGVLWKECDVSNISALKSCFEAVFAAHDGRLDVLVSNAGIWTCGDMEAVSEVEFDKVVGINVKGAFFSVANAVPAMKKAGKGNIVIMGSDQSFIGKADQYLYGVTKGALGQLTKSTAASYGPLGITVNCVCPGTIETPLMHGAVQKMVREHGAVAADIYTALNTAQPVPRVGRPEEVAQAVLSCCVNGFMNGSMVSVDGGYVAQ